MPYDFGEHRNRTGTDCLKYDARLMRKGRTDLLPMWVADMDFALPEEVLAPIRASIDHGIFGYSFPGDAYFDAVQGWFRTRFAWQTDREWIVQTPGVVFALATAVQAFTEPGDAVLVQQPVYYPFSQVVRRNGRVLSNNELVYAEGRYQIDFDDFERCIERDKVKMFILCSPHNPVGRVWTEEELRRMGDICLAHDVVIVSDEIHADFVYPGSTHRIFASLGPAYAARCVVCTAPSKTFNIAGLQASNIFIPDEGLRARFTGVLGRLGYDGIGVLSMTAARAAYEHGGPWHDRMLDYLAGNLDLLRDFTRVHASDLRLVEPEGTYLVWLDCSGLGVPAGETDAFFIDQAHLWLDAGSLFGAHSERFERMNIACPRATLEQALDLIAHALDARPL
jgi:cystathionine beta-lyase